MDPGQLVFEKPADMDIQDISRFSVRSVKEGYWITAIT